MKRILCITGALAYMLAFGMETATAQVGLDDAIQSVSRNLAPHLGNVRAAVAPIDAGTVGMSNHIMNRLTSVLAGRFSMVERSELDRLFAEQDIQMGERFDEARAVSITRGLGAQFLVLGAFQRIGGFYDFRVRIIDVETHVIVGAYETRVQDSALIRDLLGMDFTTGQRWAAVGMNLVPGLGSFVIMGDTFGGVVQLVVGGAGVGLLIFGLGQGITEEVHDLVWGTTQQEINATGLVGVIAGGALIAGQVVFNLVRSHTYTRPAVRAASVVDPRAWNIGLVPGENGIERVSLSHTLRF